MSDPTDVLRMSRALTYVQQHHPDVAAVVLCPDGRWVFFTETHHVPPFSDAVDASELEELLQDLPPGVWFDSTRFND